MDTLTIIERYGSFGLVCLLMVAMMAGVAASLKFVRDTLFPRLMQYLEAKDAAHAAERREERAANLAALTALSDKIDAQGQRLDRIEAHLPRPT